MRRAWVASLITSVRGGGKVRAETQQKIFPRYEPPGILGLLGQRVV